VLRKDIWFELTLFIIFT